MTKTKVAEVRKSYSFSSSVKCGDCAVQVPLISTDELTPAQLQELQDRMVCHPCLKKQLAITEAEKNA